MSKLLDSIKDTVAETSKALENRSLISAVREDDLVGFIFNMAFNLQSNILESRRVDGIKNKELMSKRCLEIIAVASSIYYQINLTDDEKNSLNNMYRGEWHKAIFDKVLEGFNGE